MKISLLALAAAVSVCPLAIAQHSSNPMESVSSHQPSEFGVLIQGGNGLTDNRGGFHFLAAGVHAGRVLTPNFGPGPLRGNFEYAVELFPYWQSFTPTFQRVRCTQAPGTAIISCSQPFNTGGTYSGATITPIILRWNFAQSGRLVPWVQGAGGVLWTNHKYPAYGSTTPDLQVNGPNGETSVWNFTPQFGVGAHLFTRPRRSVDFSANAVHISSASLGDRNPGSECKPPLHVRLFLVEVALREPRLHPRVCAELLGRP